MSTQVSRPGDLMAVRHNDRAKVVTLIGEALDILNEGPASAELARKCANKLAQVLTLMASLEYTYTVVASTQVDGNTLSVALTTLRAGASVRDGAFVLASQAAATVLSDYHGSKVRVLLPSTETAITADFDVTREKLNTARNLWQTASQLVEAVEMVLTTVD